MQRLFDKREAYERFDRAQALAADGKTAQAASLVREAVRIEPREGHFHSFLGDVAQAGGDYTGAERHYDRAISLNDDFFYYFLQRGKVNEAQRDARAAQADYARSVKLLPTADAQAGLGAIAEARGNEAAAQRWYAMAAQTNGSGGKRARAALAKLAPPSDARNFVQVRTGTTRSGNLAFELTNQTSRPVGNVRLGVRLAPGAATREQRVPGRIPAGGRRVVDTGRPITRARLAGVRVGVLGAEIAGRR